MTAEAILGIASVLERSSNMFHPEFHIWFDSHWRDYVKHYGDMEPLRAGEALPQSCGIYFLWGDDMRLVYVGQSLEINRRLMMHRRYGKRHFAASAIEVCPAALHAVECAYIEALDPPLNGKYPTSCWSGHADMVKAIRELWGADTSPSDGVEMKARR